MSNKCCELKESSHSWIGDTCTECGVARSVWTKNIIRKRELLLAVFVDPKDVPDPGPSRRTREEVQIIDELYRRKNEYKNTHAYVTVTQPVVLRKWNGSHHPTTEANMTDAPVPAGTTLKIVMVSRFGDCGLTDDLNAENGYHLRVDLDSDVISNLRWRP